MRHLLVTTVLVTILLTVQSSSAQEPKRIHFAKGKNSAVVSGTTGNRGTSYVIRARSGQKLVLTVTPRTGVGIKVETNGSYGEMVLLRKAAGGTYEVGLEETGDHTIFLGSTNGRSAAFTLTVKIENFIAPSGVVVEVLGMTDEYVCFQTKPASAKK